MQEKQNWLNLLLVGVLVLNIAVLSNISNLNNQYQSLQGQLSNISYQVASEVRSISWNMDSIRDDARWWGSVREETELVAGNTYMLKLGFQLKEYTEDSQISINYRLERQGDFASVEAERQADGYFTALIPVEVPLEPPVQIQISRIGPNGAWTDGSAEIDEGMYMSRALFQYYIVSRTGTLVRTSDEFTIYSDSLKYTLFSPLDVTVSIDRNGTVNSYISSYLNQKPSYNIQDIRLETRQGSRVTGRWPYTVGRPQGHPGEEYFWEVSAKPESEQDALFVVIRYAEGLTFEREIRK
jgi:hypothetical protein